MSDTKQWTGSGVLGQTASETPKAGQQSLFLYRNAAVLLAIEVAGAALLTGCASPSAHRENTHAYQYNAITGYPAVGGAE